MVKSACSIFTVWKGPLLVIHTGTHHAVELPSFLRIYTFTVGFQTPYDVELCRSSHFIGR